MKIACTVGEFADIVHGCRCFMKEFGCIKCPLGGACSNEGIEIHVSARDIFDDAEDEAERVRGG